VLEPADSMDNEIWYGLGRNPRRITSRADGESYGYQIYPARVVMMLRANSLDEVYFFGEALERREPGVWPDYPLASSQKWRNFFFHHCGKSYSFLGLRNLKLDSPEWQTMWSSLGGNGRFWGILSMSDLPQGLSLELCQETLRFWEEWTWKGQKLSEKDYFRFFQWYRRFPGMEK
jgi:hypothetical protein